MQKTFYVFSQIMTKYIVSMQTRSQKLQLKYALVLNSGLFNKLVAFSKRIVDLFDKVCGVFI